MTDMWKRLEAEEAVGFMLVDARNAFNELNHEVMLWVIRHEWPQGARFVLNCNDVMVKATQAAVVINTSQRETLGCRATARVRPRNASPSIARSPAVLPPSRIGSILEPLAR